MNILVTGATGFVGSWTARRLVEQGHTVRILRRESSDLSEIEDVNLEHRIGDITDYDSLVRAADGVDSIFHLAGVVGYSKAARALMDKVNVDGTRNVVNACKQLNLGRLLHFSSVVAVGAGFTEKEILNEESPFNISHLNLGYFETKRQAEEIVVNAVKNDGLDAVMVNPSTIYGPGDAKKGSRSSQLKVARGKFPFYTSGGVNIISIHDLLDGTMSAFKNGKSGERYILSGDNIKIKRLFEIIADCAGVKPPGVYLPNPVVHAIGKVGDALEGIGKKGPINTENAWTSTMFHWFDSAKAQRELGLKPRPAEQAIEESVKWIRDNGLLQ